MFIYSPQSIFHLILVKTTRIGIIEPHLCENNWEKNPTKIEIPTSVGQILCGSCQALEPPPFWAQCPIFNFSCVLIPAQAADLDSIGHCTGNVSCEYATSD